MEIKILGTRGEIEESAPYHSKHSGILINNKLLVDCGEQSFLDYDPHYILITHLHPDHAFFVRSGCFQMIDIPIYAPKKYKELLISTRKTPFTIDGYRITPIPTIHSLKVKSVAYIIQHKNKKILYTGDMIWIEKKYHHLLKNFDLVITEASHMRTGGLIRRHKKSGKIYGHTGVPDLVRFFKKYACTIVFVHFGAWFYKDMQAARKKFEKLAVANDIEIIVGYDGLELIV